MGILSPCPFTLEKQMPIAAQDLERLYIWSGQLKLAQAKPLWVLRRYR
jgi:hypothetical protein